MYRNFKTFFGIGSKNFSKIFVLTKHCLIDNFKYVSKTYKPQPMLSNKTQDKLSLSLKFCFKNSRELPKSFHTSSVQNLNPLVVLVLRPLSKVTAVLVGRGFRKWWKALPKHKRKLLLSHVKRNRWRYLASLFLFGGSGFYVYKTHICVTPYTGRKRFMVFDTIQMHKISDFSFEAELEVLKDRLLPSSHPHVVRMRRICEKLLKGNRDIPEIYTKYWTVSVADLPEENCKVFPTGQILMYSGMLELADNDDQVAAIIAHEISHVILEHTAELFNYAALVDMLTVVPLALIWALLPNDGVAAVFHWFLKRVVDTLVHLPYSRMLESEADFLGIFLAASACFDVREASAFWGRLDLIEKYRRKSMSENADTPEIAFLSTHPSHSDRQDMLDDLMASAIQTREARKCPRLCRIDPRDSVRTLQEQFQTIGDQKKIAMFTKFIKN